MDSIMGLVDCPIYVADKNGMVLAAKEQARVGTFSFPALQAVRMTVAQTIFPGQEDLFQVAAPGMVLPLRSDGQVVGALGMIGHPDVVKNAAFMAIRITELLIEREGLQQEVRSRYQLNDQFIGLIIAGSTDDKDITRLADILRFDLNLSRMAAVVNFLPKYPSIAATDNGHAGSARVSESARYLLQNSTFVTSADLVGLWDQRLLILKYIPGKTKKLDQWCNDLISLLTGSISDISVQLGLGSFVDDWALLPASYQEARFSLRECGANRFASIYDVAILAGYFFANNDTAKNLHPIITLADQIKAARLIEKYDIANSVTVLLANNLNLACAAKELYIHRNTLIARLDKLKEATGLDPCHSFDHAVVCRVLFSSQAKPG